MPKINLILTFLLCLGLLALFFEFFTLTKSQSFTDKRLDVLEVRPISENSLAAPVAGASGAIDITAIKSYIDQKVSENNTKTTATTTTSPKSTATPQPKRITSFMPIFGGNFATSSTDWADVTGTNFQFNVSDFGNSSYITWDSYMWVIGGSGEVHARIFDVTNGVAVQGSEITGTGSSSTFTTSGKLTFFSGNNTYRVQLKSLNSSTVQFDGGRLKMVYY